MKKVQIKKMAEVKASLTIEEALLLPGFIGFLAATHLEYNGFYAFNLDGVKIFIEREN